jgi:hypothetical protein
MPGFLPFFSFFLGQVLSISSKVKCNCVEFVCIINQKSFQAGGATNLFMFFWCGVFDINLKYLPCKQQTCRFWQALAKTLTVAQIAFLREQFTLLGPSKNGFISMQNFKTVSSFSSIFWLSVLTFVLSFFLLLFGVSHVNLKDVGINRL